MPASSGWNRKRGNCGAFRRSPSLHHAAGRPARADAALAQLVTGYADVAAFQIAEVYGYRGDADRAFEWLERAYRQRDGGLSQLKGNPHMSRLESDPRYADFLRKMDLPP